MIEVLKQAIDYIDNVPDDRDNVGHIDRSALVLSLRQAIREHAMYDMQRLGQEIEQEPVTKPTEDMVLALRGNSGLGSEDAYDALVDVLAVIPLYTHPPQRTWQGLTDEETIAIELGLRIPTSYRDAYDLSLRDFARAIEAKLKEKNT